MKVSTILACGFKLVAPFAILSIISIISSCGSDAGLSGSHSSLQARPAECFAYPESKPYEDTRYHVREVRDGIPAACQAAKASCKQRNNGDYCSILRARTL